MTNDTTFTFKTPVKQGTMGQPFHQMVQFDEDENDDLIGSVWNERAEGVRQLAELNPPRIAATGLDAINKFNTIKDYTNYDPSDPLPTATKIRDAVINNDTKTLNRIQMTPISTVTQLNHEVAVHVTNDPTATFGEKVLAVAADVITTPVIAMGQGIESGVLALGNLTGWC